MASGPSPAVKVDRLDDGGPKDKGHYRCSLCAWENKAACASTPREHVRHNHEGRRVEFVRAVPQARGGRVLLQDPKSVKNREWWKRTRDEKQVRHSIMKARSCGYIAVGGLKEWTCSPAAVGAQVVQVDGYKTRQPTPQPTLPVVRHRWSACVCGFVSCTGSHGPDQAPE